MIDIKNGIEVSGPGRYQATVVVEGRERTFCVPGRDFHNDRLTPLADEVIELLREADALYFYEYDAAGNKIYSDLQYHAPQHWQAALDGQVGSEVQ